MAEIIEPFKFNFHAGDVGHTIVIGPTRSGKAVPAALVELWGSGRRCGSVSVAQAGDDEQGE